MGRKARSGTRLQGRAISGASLAAWLAAVALMATATVGRAEPPPVMHYEPPPVDAVYPADPGAEAAPPPAPPVPAPPLPAPPAPEPTPPEPPATEPQPAAAEPTQAPPAPPVAEYGARARLNRPAARGTQSLSLEATRDVPGSFGDPMRVLDSLPGVVPLTSGLPYVYIRGAPPAAQGFVYDDIPLPLLFHAAFGPAVLHPRTTGSVRLFGGIPDARYGRRVGGALLAEGTPQQHRFGAELELRLIDVGAWVETPVGKGTLTTSGRIGFPGLVLKATEALGVTDKGINFPYADGQVRFHHPINKHDSFELVWLGSYDKPTWPGPSGNLRAGTSMLHFHRVETRLIHKRQRSELGTALRFGFDESELGTALSVRAFTFGPRMWTALRLGRHQLRAGAEIYASRSDIENLGGSLSSPDGDLRVGLPTIATDVTARNHGGVYVQGSFWLGDDTVLDAGLRLDYWSVRSVITLGPDVRLRLTHNLNERWAVHGAFGTSHQPAVFLLPTPGLTDVALDKGLMRALQSEVGVDYELTRTTHLMLQGYFHHYDDLLLLELIRDGDVPEEPPLVSSNAYGIETFLRRDLSERVSGWISYTLGWAKADSGPGVVGSFRPDFDVRHIVNTVLAYRVWRGLSLGTRFQARSGRMVEQLNPRYTQRLPWFFRVDVRIGYSWPGRFAKMTAYLEWLNVSARREYTDIDCLLGACRAKPAPLLTIPLLGIRAEL